MATYGRSLEEADEGRDWSIELIEELVDGLQYAAKEIRELRLMIATLERENLRLQEQLRTPFHD